MPRLSIVIPYLSADEPLEDTLASVLQNRPFDCEVIVVHRGPYEDPYDLGDEVRFVSADRNSGVANCLNSAVQAAHGDVVHFLRCGCEVEEGWTNVAIGHFDDPRVAMVSPLVIDTKDNDSVMTAGVRMAIDGSRQDCGAGNSLSQDKPLQARPTGPSLLAGFYRRQIAIACGGFSSEVNGHFVDLDLALSIRGLQFTCVLEPACIVRGGRTAAPNHGPISRGRNAQRMAWRHAGSNGWTKTILAHPVAVAAGVVAGCWHPATWLQLVGRAGACFEINRFLRHHRRLGQARARLDCELPMTVAMPRSISESTQSTVVEPRELKRSA